MQKSPINLRNIVFTAKIVKLFDRFLIEHVRFTYKALWYCLYHIINSHGIHIWIISQNFNLTNQQVPFTFKALWYRLYHTIQNSHGIHIWIIPQNFSLTKFETSMSDLPVGYYDIVYITRFLKFRDSQGILFMKFPQNFNFTEFETSISDLLVRHYDICYMV